MGKIPNSGIYEIPGKKGWFFDKEGLLAVDVQARVHQWAETTFGSATHIMPLFQVILDSVDNLSVSVDMNNTTLLQIKADPQAMRDINKECASLTIDLLRLAGSLGFDLLHEVDMKQAINEERRWERNEDGTGYPTNTDV